MKIKRINPDFNGSNTYIIYDEKLGEGAMIDPGDKGAMLLSLTGDIKIKYIILTHAHFDHIGALSYVAEKTGAEVVISEMEAPALTNTKFNLCHLARVPENDRGADIVVKNNDILTLGDITFKFILTPGHTMGSMCILAGDKDLFTGDTLFKGCIGRTDLPGGNSEEILKSVNDLAQLDENIAIYPGHGEVSTIGFEKRTNPYIYD